MDVTLFGFAAGQKLTEHTSPYVAMIQVLKGDLSLTLDGEELFVKEGCWVNMPPNLPHALEAKTEVVMLLTMVKE
jgi:quercetin dioxygenase-like cupin family protein